MKVYEITSYFLPLQLLSNTIYIYILLLKLNFPSPWDVILKNQSSLMAKLSIDLLCALGSSLAPNPALLCVRVAGWAFFADWRHPLSGQRDLRLPGSLPRRLGTRSAVWNLARAITRRLKEIVVSAGSKSVSVLCVQMELRMLNIPLRSYFLQLCHWTNIEGYVIRIFLCFAEILLPRSCDYFYLVIAKVNTFLDMSAS